MSSSPRIFFDFDGPILEVSARHYQVYADSVGELGGQPLTKEIFWEAKRRREPEAGLLARSGLAPAQGGAFQKLKLARIEARDYLALDTVQTGVREILDRLHGRYPLTLVTLRNSRAMLEEQLAALDLVRFFPVVLSGREANQEGWRIKCDLLQSAPPAPTAADWIIGDTETDILTGQKLGMQTVAVTNGIRAEHLLQALKPHHLLASAAQLADTGLLPQA